MLDLDRGRGCTPTPAGRPAPCSRTCPATSCSSSSRTRLGQLVTDIVGLQERQLVRVFEVPDPVGPWVTVLVYLPRNRFTAELPGRVADAVAGAYGAERAHVRVVRRRPARSPASRSACAGRTPTAASTSTPSNAPSTSCRRRGPTACAARWSAPLGEAAGRDLFERVGAHAPPAYRAAVVPERAIGDVRQIAVAARRRRRAGDAARPRRRRARRRVAVPRLPPGRAGRAVRAAPAPRPPRPGGARRAAVHVPGRRPAGVPLRHRRAGARRRRARRRTAGPSCRPLRAP